MNIETPMTAILSGNNPPTPTILYPYDVTLYSSGEQWQG